MSARPHDQSENEQRLERRRWFEHIVMVPVGFGMIASFSAGATAHLATALGAPMWVVDKPWVTAAFIIGFGIVFFFSRSMRG